MYFQDDDADAAEMALMSASPATPCTPRKIFEGCAGHDTTYALLNRYGAASPFAHIGLQAGHWYETTEDLYWYFLECMPPLYQRGGDFVMLECVTADLHTGFIRLQRRYFCTTVRSPGRQDLSTLRAHIAGEIGS